MVMELLRGRKPGVKHELGVIDTSAVPFLKTLQIQDTPLTG
jgi:hypothetical protein